MEATPSVSQDRLVHQGADQDHYTVKFAKPDQPDQGTWGVLSIQPDGSFGWRPAGTAGPWEVGTLVDDKLVFTDSAYPLGAFAVLVA